jgi:hypothetical protein
MNYELLISRSTLMEYANGTETTSATAMVVDATLAGPLDWEAKREKIVRLYFDHSVKQIKKIMEDEGFSAR